MNVKNSRKRFYFYITIIVSIFILSISAIIFVVANNTSISNSYIKATVSLISGLDIETSIMVDNVCVGSGFFYDKGLILTANHNVTNKCFAVTYDGDVYETIILYNDYINDIAILKIESNKYPYLKISKNELKINDSIKCICTPKTVFLKSTVLNGKVTNTNINGLSNQYLLQTDLPLSPGCSGSPLINKHGEVVGMNAFKSTEFATESLSYAIQSVKLKDAIRHFNDNKLPLNYGLTLDESLNTQYGLLLEPGISVKSVDDNSIFKGYILIDDIILNIDNNPVFTKADFYENYNLESTINISRNGELINITI